MIDTHSSLDIGSRIATITVFLLGFWWLSTLLTRSIKEGKFRIPPFLLGKFKFLETLKTKFEQPELHKLEIIQTKAMPDGSQLYVLDADGRHLLLSRSLSGNLQYLCDLESK